MLLPGRGIQKLVQLEPSLVLFADSNFELPGKGFVPRFAASMDDLWMTLEENNTLMRGKGKGLLSVVEESFHHHIVYANLARDEEAVPMQQHSWEEWERLWKLWGFKPKPVRPGIAKALSRIVASYGNGYGVTKDRNHVHLTWQARPRISMSFWTL